MDTLTPELKRAVEEAGDSPLRLLDPETRQAYVILNAEIYDRMLSDLDDRREEGVFLNLAMKNAKARLRADE